MIQKEIKKMILNGGGFYQGIVIPPLPEKTNSNREDEASKMAQKIYQENLDFLHLLLE